MIFINESPIEALRYPDGTWNLRVPESDTFPDVNTLRWEYHGEDELSLLTMLTLHLKERFPAGDIILDMPYVPNARLDRVKRPEEIFTLKYFARFINGLGFKKVVVRDPHSPVVTALIDNIECQSIQPYVLLAMSHIEYGLPPLIFYPDFGAVRRYSSLDLSPYGYGVKFRNWDTRELRQLVIAGNPGYSGRDVLIVDDICCSGSTAVEAARVLKSVGAKEVYLYVTHLEASALGNPELWNGNAIERVFTTNPLFSETELLGLNATVLKLGGRTNTYSKKA